MKSLNSKLNFNKIRNKKEKLKTRFKKEKKVKKEKEPKPKIDKRKTWYIVLTNCSCYISSIYSNCFCCIYSYNCSRVYRG